MKKRISIVMDDKSVAYTFLMMLGNRKGRVLTEIINEHLKKNDGYISGEVAARANYQSDKRDVAFAEQYRYGTDYVAERREKEVEPVKRDKKRPNKPPVRLPQKEEKALDMDLVMSGMAAFLQ